jgi:hypothetical protein
MASESRRLLVLKLLLPLFGFLVGLILAEVGSGDFWFEAGKGWSNAHPEHGAVYDEANVRTVLTTAYRLTALDVDDLQVGSGILYTKESFRWSRVLGRR